MTKTEAELHVLDERLRKRINEAAKNITTMQHKVANAVNINNYKEMDHPSSALSPEEEPPD